jgi:soluble lytic murein transglycosylase-like protein
VNDDLQTLARQIAQRHGLDPTLVCAIVEQESAWNPWAMRYEPAFRQRYVPGNLAATEATARAFSWGLMQVMGQVAREHGCRARYLSELCDPETALDIGCRVLSAKLDQAGGDLRRALLLWNGGGRPEYADEVLARVARYQGAAE